MGEQVQIKEELTDFFPWPKSGRTDFGEEYVLVVKDEAQFERYAKAFAEKGGTREPADLEESRRQTVGVLLEGEDELKQDFIKFEVEDRGFSFEKLMRLDTKLTKILKGGLRTNI